MGYTLPSRLRGMGDHRKLPQQDLEQKMDLVHSELEGTHLTTTNSV